MIPRGQNAEYKGNWWLPDNIDKKMMGILRYSPNEGFELEVIGAFMELQDIFSKSQNPEIIQGTSSEGKIITLYKCYISRRTISSSESCTTKFKPANIFIGMHFDKEIKFKKFIINYSNLDEWVNIDGFSISDPSTGELQITYKIPDDIIVPVNENYELSITFSVEGPNWSIVQKESCIKQITHITIESKKDTPIAEYEEMMYKIRNLLSLGVGKPIYALAIIGQTEKCLFCEKPRRIYNDIEIYYNFDEIPDKLESIIPQNMLFNFKNISKSFELFIKNWFNKSEVLAPVFDLYFSVIYNPNLYLDTKFLNEVQALESYHRRKETTEKYDVSPEEHKVRMENILCSIPIDYKNWLSKKLLYSNEVSLRQRLKEIIVMHKEIAEKYIGNKDQQKEFISSVVTTRNYLTHFDEEQEHKRAKGQNLLIIIDKLKILIKACLLEEMGMSNSEIVKLFNKK